MSYLTILRAAFTIVRRHPSLLGAGFFVATILGWGGYNFFRELSDFATLDLPLKLMRREWHVGVMMGKLGQTFTHHPVQASGAIFLPVIFIIMGLGIALLSLAYLTAGTVAASEGWFARVSVWRRSRSHFWQIVGLGVILQLIGKGFLILLTLITLGWLTPVSPQWGSALFDFGFFLLAFPLTLLLSVVWRISLVFLLTQGQGIRRSLGHALSFMHEHWLAALEFAFLVALTTIVGSGVALILSGIVGTPLILLSIIAGNMSAPVLAQFLGSAALILVSLIIFFIGLVLVTSLSSAWVVFILTAREGGVKSWLHILLTRRERNVQ